MTKNPERFVTVELAAVVNGRPLPSRVYRETLGADIEAALTNGQSGNIFLTGHAVAYELGEPVEDEIVRFLQASVKQWEGDEEGTTIYGPMHVLAVASIHDTATRLGHQVVVDLAASWLGYWNGFYSACRTSAGGYLTVGARSGGHTQTEPGNPDAAAVDGSPLPVPEAGWIGYIHAAMRGEDLAPRVATCKALGLAPKNSWIPGTVAALVVSLRVGAATPMPKFGLMSPVHVLTRDGGATAVWMERDVNGNTPGLMAATWDGERFRYLPPAGGVHLREEFDHATCTRDGAKLVYTSSYEEQARVELELPFGGDGVESVLGA